MEPLSNIFNEMVGKKLDIDEVNKHHKGRVRVFDPVNCIGTCDYDPTRLNIYLDDKKVVQRFKLG